MTDQWIRVPSDEWESAGQTRAIIERDLAVIEAEARDKELLPDRLEMAGWVTL